MNVSETTLEKLLSQKSENVHSLYMNNLNITGFTLNFSTFEHIQILNISNNQIKSISFLTFFPNIWHLDLRNNYIENFDILSKHNVLGFLGVTLNKFSEISFFQLRRLNIGILIIDGKLEDIQKFNIFVYNSPNNFLKVNEDVILFCDKFKIFSNSIDEVISSFTQNKISRNI
jgi:hypothetical protein